MGTRLSTSLMRRISDSPARPASRMERSMTTTSGRLLQKSSSPSQRRLRQRRWCRRSPPEFAGIPAKQLGRHQQQGPWSYISLGQRTADKLETIDCRNSCFECISCVPNVRSVTSATLTRRRTPVDVVAKIRAAKELSEALRCVVRRFAADTGALHILEDDGMLHLKALSGEFRPPVLAIIQKIRSAKEWQVLPSRVVSPLTPAIYRPTRAATCDLAPRRQAWRARLWCPCSTAPGFRGERLFDDQEKAVLMKRHEPWQAGSTAIRSGHVLWSYVWRLHAALGHRGAPSYLQTECVGRSPAVTANRIRSSGPRRRRP
jgi:hypothetical protein